MSRRVEKIAVLANGSELNGFPLESHKQEEFSSYWITRVTLEDRFQHIGCLYITGNILNLICPGNQGFAGAKSRMHKNGTLVHHETSLD